MPWETYIYGYYTDTFMFVPNKKIHNTTALFYITNFNNTCCTSHVTFNLKVTCLLTTYAEVTIDD